MLTRQLQRLFTRPTRLFLSTAMGTAMASTFNTLIDYGQQVSSFISSGFTLNPYPYVRVAQYTLNGFIFAGTSVWAWFKIKKTMEETDLLERKIERLQRKERRIESVLTGTFHIQKTLKMERLRLLAEALDKKSEASLCAQFDAQLNEAQQKEHPEESEEKPSSLNFVQQETCLTDVSRYLISSSVGASFTSGLHYFIQNFLIDTLPIDSLYKETVEVLNDCFGVFFFSYATYLAFQKIKKDFQQEIQLRTHVNESQQKIKTLLRTMDQLEKEIQITKQFINKLKDHIEKQARLEQESPLWSPSSSSSLVSHVEEPAEEKSSRCICSTSWCESSKAKLFFSLVTGVSFAPDAYYCADFLVSRFMDPVSELILAYTYAIASTIPTVHYLYRRMKVDTHELSTLGNTINQQIFESSKLEARMSEFKEEMNSQMIEYHHLIERGKERRMIDENLEAHLDDSFDIIDPTQVSPEQKDIFVAINPVHNLRRGDSPLPPAASPLTPPRSPATFFRMPLLFDEYQRGASLRL